MSRSSSHRLRATIITVLLALGAAAILWVGYSMAVAFWLAAHPQHDDLLWGQRAMRLLLVLCVLIPLEVVGIGWALFRVAKHQQQRMVGLCRHCKYPLVAGAARCPECGQLLKEE